MVASPPVRHGRRLLAALRALGPRGLRERQRAVAASSRRSELTYTRDNGRTDVIPLLTAPVLLARSDAAYLHRLCLLFVGALRKTAAARAVDPAVRATLPLAPAEEEWLALAPPGRAPVVARWDMNIDPARGGARAATLFELNGCAIGGLHYGPRSSEIALAEVGGLAAPARVILPAAMDEVWRGLLADHARSLGRPGLSVAWLEDQTWDVGITEGPSLAARLTRQGQRAVVADPRELTLRGGEVRCQGQALDLIYRSIEVRDLCEIERESGPLRAMREAFRRGLVMSPAEGDLDHKSLLEVWSSERFAAGFSARERAAFRRHVPWTRLLSERRTDGPTGASVDLPAYARRHRARLVLKPNRSCGGEGVLIGRDTRPATWERAIARALSGAEPAVVQALVKSAVIANPVVRGGRAAVEEHYTTYGLFAAPTGLGFLGRAAPFPVVNVSRGGGLLGVLLV